MEKFWSPDRTFWSPTCFIYNLHNNTILYVSLHARKVTIEERIQLERTRVTLSYKTTVVLNSPFPRYLNRRGIWERIAQKQG